MALDVDPTATDYPVAAVDAVIDATGEAVANSLRHAGAGASQVVVGQLTTDAIRVRVADDGVGFNPDRVSGDRMGIEVGIRQRIRSVPGGAVDIDSSPGNGTMVSLEWRR
ncbi:MAG: ATP-binding protein [Gordonia sp. (in: high G+C Gram-positive bacteria)]|uniref:sensor histidine kinase n=1 Tax=Gordonia sp. (in: high G+C Gram-positive bacteria) TaxID=84139 RepID=UPI003BB5141F